MKVISFNEFVVKCLDLVRNEYVYFTKNEYEIKFNKTL